MSQTGKPFFITYSIFSETMFSPHTLEPKESLTLKYLLQHQPWRGSYQLKLDDAAENMSENLVNIVNEQLEFLDRSVK